MSLRHRPMRAEDVPECVRIIAVHPVIGPRYGNAIENLGPAWLRLLGNEAMVTAVFEEVEGTRVSVWGVGVSVVIQEDFLRRLKKRPLFWFVTASDSVPKVFSFAARRVLWPVSVITCV